MLGLISRVVRHSADRFDGGGSERSLYASLVVHDDLNSRVTGRKTEVKAVFKGRPQNFTAASKFEQSAALGQHRTELGPEAD